MKSVLPALLSLLLGSCILFQNKKSNYHQQLENCRRNPETWDTAMFALDLMFNQSRVTAPMSVGTYPTPDYNSLDSNSFHGVGTYYNDLTWNNKHVLHSTFYYKSVKNNETFEHPFLTIVTLADNIDTVDYSHVQNEIISRNHPDYIGQGRMIVSDQNIDYVAFHTQDGDEYAIVNMRLFNLSYGHTIFIKTMNDGSLRSMQLDTDFKSLDEIDTFFISTSLPNEVLLFLNSTT
jgi:ribosomal protein L31